MFSPRDGGSAGPRQLRFSSARRTTPRAGVKKPRPTPTSKASDVSPPRKRISKRLAAAAGGRTTSNPSNPSNPLGKVFVVHDQLRRGTVCYLMAKGMEYKCTVKTFDKWSTMVNVWTERHGEEPHWTEVSSRQLYKSPVAAAVAERELAAQSPERRARLALSAADAPVSPPEVETPAARDVDAMEDLPVLLDASEIGSPRSATSMDFLDAQADSPNRAAPMEDVSTESAELAEAEAPVAPVEEQLALAEVPVVAEAPAPVEEQLVAAEEPVDDPADVDPVAVYLALVFQRKFRSWQTRLQFKEVLDQIVGAVNDARALVDRALSNAPAELFLGPRAASALRCSQNSDGYDHAENAHAYMSELVALTEMLATTAASFGDLLHDLYATRSHYAYEFQQLVLQNMNSSAIDESFAEAAGDATEAPVVRTLLAFIGALTEPTADSASRRRRAGRAYRDYLRVHVATIDAIICRCHETKLVHPFHAVWKSTAGLGRPDQTLQHGSSAKSKSIRLIFGRIDRSRRALEARRKCSCQSIRIRAH